LVAVPAKEDSMIVTIRVTLGPVFKFWDEHISGDGAWWILMLDSVFFVPLIFAVFFWPKAVLIGIVVTAVLTFGAIGLRRVVHPRR
jgi:hypothetical protein